MGNSSQRLKTNAVLKYSAIILSSLGNIVMGADRFLADVLSLLKIGAFLLISL
jgi:hypothetical protein